MIHFPPCERESSETRLPGSFATISPQRLNAACERIDKACADYSYFNPTFCLENHGCHPASCTEKEHGTCSHPPDPQQLKADLKVLFDRVWVLGSPSAEEGYEGISVQVSDMANDEHSGFDWEMFRRIIHDGLKGLIERGRDRIDISTLKTLRQKDASPCSG